MNKKQIYPKGQVIMAPLNVPKIVQIDQIPVMIQRHRLTKSLRLRIDPLLKQPIVRAPRRLALTHIESFLWQHHDWMKGQLAAFSPSLASDEILLNGETYQLIQESAFQKRFMIHFDHAQRVIYHNTSPDLIKTRLKPFLKRQSLAIIQQHCQMFSRQLGVDYKAIQIKDYKSRWGSCRQDGVLSFSWRLILAPPMVLEYICAHEVAHLIHMNHRPVFWQVVATLFPAYKQAKAWLKENGKSLFQQF